MPESDVAILGNSPFINQVNVPALIERYTTVGFNGMGQHHPVDALFLFDRWYEPGKAKKVFYPHYFSRKEIGEVVKGRAFPFDPKPSKKPIVPGEIKDWLPVYGFKYFTPSIALNWSILQGHKRAYLVAIDNVESDTKFAHHDGADCRSQLTPKAHQAFKQYVYACTKYIEIYQTNPAVKDGWDLPFKNVSELYEPQAR